MTARILGGTCSWTDESLVDCGRFYPPHLKTAEERLRFYADQFSLVEVDSPRLRPPDAQERVDSPQMVRVLRALIELL